MLRGNALIIRGLCAHDFIHSKIFVQSVRWKRKPIWLPTAKSKMFRVPQRPKIPEEEKKELKRLNANYKTYMNSLIHHFHKIHIYQTSQERQDMISAEWEREFEESRRINNEWNESVAAERKKRLEKEKEEEVKRVEMKLQKNAEEMAKKLIEIEAEVATVLEQAENFITEQNIDAAIDEALKHVENHNYTIDVHGNIQKEVIIAIKNVESREEKVQAC